jgi:hypothetical protein
MPTKLTRIKSTDWDRLDHIRKSQVKEDGQNRTIADAFTVVLDRYDMTGEMLFEMSKSIVLDAVKQSQE